MAPADRFMVPDELPSSALASGSPDASPWRTQGRAQSDFDPLTELRPDDPARTYARLRETTPVHRSAKFGAWVLTRHADALAVLTDASYLADDPIARFDLLERRGGPPLTNLRTLLANVAFFTNPPRHIQLRKFMSRLLQTSEVVAIGGAVKRRASDLIDAGRGSGRVDLAGLGRDLAVFTISSLVGLPFEDCLELVVTGRDVAWIFDLTPTSLRQLRRAEHSAGALLDYFEAQIDRARKRQLADRFSRLVARGEAELGLSTRELAGLITFIFNGGQESTAAGISAAAVMLLQRGELRARLAVDPTEIPGAAREFLRLACPFQYVARIASRDSEIGGKAIRQGDRIMVVLAAANRDSAVFTNPDCVDPYRPGAESLAFGYGPYRCLGAVFAHMETEAALAALLAHPGLRLAPEAVEWETGTRMPTMTRAWAEFG